MPNSKGWKITEIVTLVVLPAALGVLWWGWTVVDAAASPLLKPLGLSYLTAGFWFTGGTLIPFVVRKPGAALIGEVLAAALESLLTSWGITALLWGAVQGLGAELIFLAFRYKRFDLWTLVLAGALSGLFSWGIDFFWSSYWTLSPWVWAVQIASVVVSGVVLAGLVSWLLGKGLVKTGVLRNLLPEES